MILKEFKDRVDKHLGRGWDADFTDEDFNNVSLVYAYHPMISDTVGKDQVAELYATGRMGIINDMCQTAAQVANCESALHANALTLENLEKRNRRIIRELEEEMAGRKAEIIDESKDICIQLEEIKKPFNNPFGGI
jgi:hypothetical protein